MEHPLFSAIRTAMASDDSTDETPPLPMREAQVEFLRTIVKAAYNRRKYILGDFVRYREGCGPLKGELKEKLSLMFWRYLDDDNAADRYRIKQADDPELKMLPDLDCLIAVFLPSGLTFWLSSSILLEGVTEL